jgi:hypothetical protein
MESVIDLFIILINSIPAGTPLTAVHASVQRLHAQFADGPAADQRTSNTAVNSVRKGMQLQHHSGVMSESVRATLVNGLRRIPRGNGRGSEKSRRRSRFT